MIPNVFGDGAAPWESEMYRKIYECQVKMWQSDATGKRALKWITMPVEKARQRADVAVPCFECRGARLGFILPARFDILGDNLGYF